MILNVYVSGMSTPVEFDGEYSYVVVDGCLDVLDSPDDMVVVATFAAGFWQFVETLDDDEKKEEDDD